MATNTEGYISSPHNPSLKAAIKLRKRHERKQKGLFLVEGQLEARRALESGRRFEQLFVCDDFTKDSSDAQIVITMSLERNTEVIRLDSKLFEKLAYRENPDGLIAVMQSWNPALQALKLKQNPLLLMIESIEKPGNLGALMRTADATGVDAIIIADPVTDIFNPNVVRASRGMLFTMPLAVCDVSEALDYLEQHKIAGVATTPTAQSTHWDINWKEARAVIVGSESAGLSKQCLERCDDSVRLPMHGSADSLNVSVSAAVVLYEALRQREGEG